MQQIRIIWFALLTSIVVYFVVAFVAIPTPVDEPFQAGFSDMVTVVLYFVAAVTFALAFVIPSMIARREPSPERTRLAFILRWAMIEATAIYGLIAAFLRQNPRLFIPLGVLAVAGMLISYPRGRSDHMR